ncbi:HEXIM protein [Trinorchestia longiramus]|nr:HEXIM protein [Trinorchestia longiramus]
MSNVQVLLPSGNLKPLGASPVSEMEARASSSSSLGDNARPSNFGYDSESDSAPPFKKFKKASRRRRKKKKAVSSADVVRVCKPYAPFNSNQFLMEEYDPLHFEPGTSSAALPLEGGSAKPSRPSPTVPLPEPSSSQDPAKPSSAGPGFVAPVEEDLAAGVPLQVLDGSSWAPPSERGEGLQFTEFCREQFMGDYRHISEVRLDNLTKAELVEEYLSLEEQLAQLQRKLKEVSEEDRERQMIIERECDVSDLQPGELLVNHEAAEKISVFKSEIHTLQLENEQFRQFNAELRAFRPAVKSRSSNNSSSCSSSSSSSSSSGWSSSDSSSDSEADDEKKEAADGDAIDEGVCPADEAPSRDEDNGDELKSEKKDEDASESVKCHDVAVTHADPVHQKLQFDAGDFMDSGVDNNEVHSEEEIRNYKVRTD